jgi:hypothetical protein
VRNVAPKAIQTKYENNPVISCVSILLTTAGCLVSDGGGGHEHARYEHHDEVIVGPPVVEVRPPEVIVR